MEATIQRYYGLAFTGCVEAEAKKALILIWIPVLNRKLGL